MGKKSISDIKRAQAVALREVGLKYAEIASQLKISQHCAKEAVPRFRTHGTYQDLPRSGRPRKISQRAARYLKRLTQGQNRRSSRLITQALHMSLSQPVSTKTVRRQLHILGYKYRVKRKKTILTITQKQKRLAWCQQHKDYTIEDWMNIIFSDETTYYVLQRKKKIMVWRTDAERLSKDCLIDTNTGKGGKVGLWG
ncbi:unnamed protein product, partial [Rotaria sp. Silwood2]